MKNNIEEHYGIEVERVWTSRTVCDGCFFNNNKDTLYNDCQEVVKCVQYDPKENVDNYFIFKKTKEEKK